jgi:hydroxypyruvate isomerase
VEPSLDDGCNYSSFLATLKKMSYQGIISIEANTFVDFKQDIQKGLKLFAHHGIYPYRQSQ